MFLKKKEEAIKNANAYINSEILVNRMKEFVNITDKFYNLEQNKDKILILDEKKKFPAILNGDQLLKDV